MPSVKDVLVAAREVISKPEAWTQDGYYAHTYEGFVTEPNDPSAQCFCMIGAVAKALDSDGSYIDDEYTEPLKKVIGSPYVEMFNDSPKTKHADVLAVFDKAIASVSQ